MRLLTAVSLVRVQQGEPKETASFQTPFLFGSTRSGWTRRPVKKTMRCIVFRAREAYAAPGCAAQSASRQRLKRRVQQGEPKETASFRTPFLFGSTRSGWTRRPVKKTMRCIVFRAREAYAAPGCAAQSASRQRLKRRVQQGEPKETASFRTPFLLHCVRSPPANGTARQAHRGC